MNDKQAQTDGVSAENRYYFDNWVFEPALSELHFGNDTVRLELQVSKLLVYLLNNQNKVITRDELIEYVWGQRMVSDDAIGRCVSILRKQLSNSDKNKYIETLRGRGYIAHFSSMTEPPVDKSSAVYTSVSFKQKSTSKQKSYRRVVLYLTIPTFVALALVYFVTT